MDGQERVERVRADMGAATMEAMDAVTPAVLEAIDQTIEAADRLAQVLHEGGCTRAFIAGLMTAGVFNVTEHLPADG